MKLILPILLVSVISLFPFHHESAADRAVRSTVLVQAESEDGESTLYCTGFVVDAAKGRALTARHCVGDLDLVQVDGADSIVLRRNDTLALISVPVMKKPPLDLRRDPMRAGLEVVSLGYGFRVMQQLHRVVASVKDGDLLLDGPLIHGMSGGPVVDSQGLVVGINQGNMEYFYGVLCGPTELIEFLTAK